MMQQLPHFPENHSTAAMASADMTVPAEWQRARLRWLQQQQQQQEQYYYQSFFTATPTALDLCRPNSTFSAVLPAGTAAVDTCCNAGFCDEAGSSVADDLLSNMPPDLIQYCPIFGSEGSVVEGGDEPGMSRFSCPPAVGGVEAAVAAAAPYQSTVDRGSWESWRKRKADHVEAIAEEPDDDGCRVEKVEGATDGCYIDAMIVPKLETDHPPISSVTTTTTTTANGSDGKPTGTNYKAASTCGTSREKSTKVPDPAAKTGYIHVRARRGQATDSHSLAERARREKISKRMKLLQELVPGCSTITGKAGVLDEIINYVQSLQRQVEFLSMKLAAANPILDSDIDAFLSKEVMQMVPHHGGALLPSSPGTPVPLDASSFLNHVNTIMQTQQAVAAPTAVHYCSSTTGLNEVAVSSSSCPGELQDSLLQNRPWW